MSQMRNTELIKEIIDMYIMKWPYDHTQENLYFMHYKQKGKQDNVPVLDEEILSLFFH